MKRVAGQLGYSAFAQSVGTRAGVEGPISALRENTATARGGPVGARSASPAQPCQAGLPSM